MSGTFNDIDVPPTLVSFAVDVASYMDVVTPELKKAGNVLVEMDIEKDENDIPVYENVLYMYDLLNKKIKEGKIQSAYAVGFGGIIEAVSKMAFGNKLGVELEDTVSKKDLVAKNYGAIILEVKAADLDQLGIPVKKIGKVTKEPVFTYKDVMITMDEALAKHGQRLLRRYSQQSQMFHRQRSRLDSLMPRQFTHQGTRLQSQRYSYLYSLVQTVSTTQQRHLRELVQTYRR